MKRYTTVPDRGSMAELAELPFPAADRIRWRELNSKLPGQRKDRSGPAFDRPLNWLPQAGGQREPPFRLGSVP